MMETDPGFLLRHVAERQRSRMQTSMALMLRQPNRIR